MKTRIYNARILTMEEGNEIFEGELWIDGDVISYVGPSVEKPEDASWDKEIDAEGNLVLPGFKNAQPIVSISGLEPAEAATFAKSRP